MFFMLKLLTVPIATKFSVSPLIFQVSRAQKVVNKLQLLYTIILTDCLIRQF